MCVDEEKEGKSFSTIHVFSKRLSIQHYLIVMKDRMIDALDKNSRIAILAALVDWKQVFPRQCLKLGVEFFIRN